MSFKQSIELKALALQAWVHIICICIRQTINCELWFLHLTHSPFLRRCVATSPPPLPLSADRARAGEYRMSGDGAGTGAECWSQVGSKTRCKQYKCSPARTLLLLTHIYDHHFRYISLPWLQIRCNIFHLYLFFEGFHCHSIVKHLTFEFCVKRNKHTITNPFEI